MLSTIGLKNQEDLLNYIPSDIRFDKGLAIADGKSEYEIVDYFNQRGRQNATQYASFLGAGVYQHYRPVVVDAIVSRGEFLTSYTPYQAEISQGTLTSIFEFQTMVCQLTGMEVANASMYDGSSAVPEAALMAVRITKRDKVLIARSVHPEYRETLKTCTQHQGMPVEEIKYTAQGGLDLDDLKSKLDENVGRADRANAQFFRHFRAGKTAVAHCEKQRRSVSGGVQRSSCTGITGSRHAMLTSWLANCKALRFRPVMAALMLGLSQRKSNIFVSCRDG